MRKFWAIVKREYVQRVRSRMFIVATVLGPLVMSLFGVVPALILSINPGGAEKIAVIDQTGQLYGAFHRALTNDESDPDDDSASARNAKSLNAHTSERIERVEKIREESFQLIDVPIGGRPIEQLKGELNDQVLKKEIDGYLILPPHLLDGGNAELFGRNVGNLFSGHRLEEALSRAVRETRLAAANIDVKVVRELSRPVEIKTFKLGERGAQRDSGEGLVLVFAVGFVIYLTILMYGQVILGAVIEEKETRIAEILFSSVRPFPLMVGKLIGVSLVALTQLAVWGFAFSVFIVLASPGLSFNIPSLTLPVFVYIALFFLLGYFIYATIYALIGSMVTTAQEGGQLAMPVIVLLVIGFYMAFPVIQNPDSPFAFWVSMVPFFAPITMLVRIVSQTPPFWQIALSLAIGFGTVVLLVWLAARVYRIGMLMYGKRATIPEVWRWVRE